MRACPAGKEDCAISPAQDDFELIERARSGDREAFGELVNRHRAKAVNWAKTITHDAGLAEDIAQDAMMRSFMELSSLRQPDRFLPWLSRIVRNKALDALRKRKRESRHVRRLEEETARASAAASPPDARPLQTERLQTIIRLTEILSERNRGVFEAYFFRGAAQEEIARDYQISAANVYNILSRSKMKIQEEHFRSEIGSYLQRLQRKHQAGSRMLSVPHFQSVYTSMGHVMHAVCAYAQLPPLHLSDTLGLTGQAFRIQAAADLGLSSSLIYDWGWVLERAAAPFGLRARWLGRPGKILNPEDLIRALELIRGAVSQGLPVMVWNLSGAEFGILYGFHDKTRKLVYRNAMETGLEIPYAKLGRTLENPELFVGALSPAGKFRPSPRDMLIQALDTITRHARGIEPAVPGYTSGLAAYDVWIQAFESGRLQPVGHAYQASLLADARGHAVAFLDSWKDRPVLQRNREIAQLWNLALQHYQTSLRLIRQLYPAFPYGMPGVRIDIRERAVDLLNQVKTAEALGIERLEKISELLSGKSDR